MVSGMMEGQMSMREWVWVGTFVMGSLCFGALFLMILSEKRSGK